MSIFRGLALAQICALAACAASSPADPPSARKEFMRLKAAYLRFCGSPEVFVAKPFASPEGRAIIAMGKRAMPFVIEEIRAGDPHGKGAAFHLVPAAPPPSNATWEEIVKSRNEALLEMYSRDWVKWWDENKNSPDWKGFRLDD